MLKAYIMIFGLIALVPHKDPATGKITSLTALVLATPSGTKYSWNTEFPPHHPQRKIYFQQGPFAVLNLAGHTIQIAAPAATPPGEITMQASLPIVDLRQVFLNDGYLSAEVPKLRAKCLRIDPSDPCTDSKGKDLLAGIITITGDWSTSVVEINDESQPAIAETDKSEYSFMAADYLPGKLVPSKSRIGGAVLLEATLTNETDLVYKEGTTAHSLPKGSCPFSSGSTQCIFMTISNHPVQPIPCKDVTEYDRVDHHFDRIYELLDYSGSPLGHAKRFLPYVFWRDQATVDKLCLGGSGGDLPAIKCPSPRISE
jgi:hypothetical protein